MAGCPEPLYIEPKTIYEWFLNVYCFFDDACQGQRGDKARFTSAWLRFRRAHPDILQTKDKASILNWIPNDWTAANPECEAPSKGALAVLDEFRITSTPKTPPLATEASASDSPAPCDDDDEPEDMQPQQNTNTASAEDDDVDVVDVDDVEVRRVAHATRYFDGFIEQELELDITKWTATEVRDFMFEHARKRGIKEDRVRTIASCAFTSDVDGALLVAGGPDLLVERTVGHCKWEKSILKRDANKLFEALDHLRSKAQASYWHRNARLQDLYASSVLREVLQAALMPRPLEDIRYVTLCTRTGGERATSIPNVEDDVAKQVGCKTQQFKVVSVVTPDDPLLVMHNVIYYHEPKTHTWLLLTSVDFMRHGDSAPSGHWHLNRAPLGELVPHWGPSNDVWHGDPVKCPIWWLLIPEGMRHHTTPERAPLYSWHTA